MAVKKLIATDFDGTFKRGKIRKSELKSIEKWRAAGGYFGIVTGRGRDFIEKSARYGIKYDYLIVYNGGLIVTADGETVFESFISPACVAEIESVFTGKSGVEYYDRADGEKSNQYYATCVSPGRALELASEINEKLGDRVTAFVNGVHVNVADKGTSKSAGVSRILEYYRLPPDAAAVVGDDYNDLEMITDHHGWAVFTARREVRKTAAHICFGVGSLARRLTKLLQTDA